MGGKRAPEWLNSPLWSSSSSSAIAPDDPRISRYASRPFPEAPARPPSRPPGGAPTPAVVPAPSPTFPVEAPREDIRDAHGNPSPSPSSPEEVSRQSQLLAEHLSHKVINLTELRRLAIQGIPDGAGIRPTVWKLLLGYLPNDRGLWTSELSKKRSQYKVFKDEALVNPSEITRRLDESTGIKTGELKGDESGLLRGSEITNGEHPLSLRKSSVWNQFFQDLEMIEQIDRDVERTHPDIHFFSTDSSFAKSNQEALKRILIVFAKLNPGIQYVQGMNEVLAPLFYVFRTDPDEDGAASAEADTFFCFSELLSEFRDNFCQQLDNSVMGIRSMVTKLSQLLKKHDEELWRHQEVTIKVLLPRSRRLRSLRQRSLHVRQGRSL